MVTNYCRHFFYNGIVIGSVEIECHSSSTHIGLLMHVIKYIFSRQIFNTRICVSQKDSLWILLSLLNHWVLRQAILLEKNSWHRLFVHHPKNKQNPTNVKPRKSFAMSIVVEGNLTDHFVKMIHILVWREMVFVLFC